MKKGIFILMLTLVSPLAQHSAKAQSISQIANSDPLIITGVIGTMNTYNYSSTGYSSPLSNSLYANMNINLYGFNMPFSFYWSNNNTSFSYPTYSFNISPKYKNWTLHVGQKTMSFSSYVFNLPFNGVGLEYNDRKLRFGAFYGSLRKAINDDPTDPTARNPQYSRYGWGVKMGYGNSRNYLDLYFFRAQDRMSSLHKEWRADLPAEDNMVLGLKGRVSVKNFLTFSANVATSLHSNDMTAKKLIIKEFPKFDNIFHIRYSTLMRFAGDAQMSLNLGSVQAALSYKMIQPDYTSLGVSYISNNMHAAGISLSTRLFKTLALSANFSGQADNLSGEQLYTTKGFVYSANASTTIGSNLSINAGYNGYRQLMGDGAAMVTDTIRVDRIMHGVNAGINYSLPDQTNSQNVGLTVSYNANKDLNEYTNNLNHSDVTSIAAGLNYGINVAAWETDINTSYSFQQSEGYQSQYNSHVFSLGASRSLLKEKNLRLSANLSYCLNQIKGQSRNNSLSADISAGYTLKKEHNFTFSAGYYNYNDMSFVEQMAYNSYDFNVSLNYTWNFTLIELKKKSKEK